MLERIYQKLRFWISQKDEKGKVSSGFLPPRVRRAALSLIDSSAGNILEVGCGEGLFLAALARKLPTLKITGIENSSAILEEAKKKLADEGIKNVELVLGQAEKIDFPDNSFNQVFCLNMLYNLSSREIVEQVIREMARVVGKNGSIIFDIRNKNNPIVSAAYKKVKAYDPGHPSSLNAYTLEEIEDLLTRHNLKIKNVVPVVKILGFLPLAYLIEAQKL